MRWRSVSAFKHEGRTMLVKRVGAEQGPTFVLVPGIGVGSAYFRRLAAALAPHARVIAVDLPGFGGAPRPDACPSIAEFAAILSAGIGDAQDPVLVGHSMGTQVVLEAALTEPERFRRLALLGTVVDPRERTAIQQGLRLAEDVALRESPIANAFVLWEYLRTGVRWYLETLPVMLDYPTEEAAARVRAAVLLLRGARDPISKRDWNRRLAAALPDCVRGEVPHLGHVLMWRGAEAVAAGLLALAARQPR